MTMGKQSKRQPRIDVLIAARKLRQDCRGQIVILFALMFAVLLAFTGLVLDGGRIYYEKRTAQVAADAAAWAGAQEIVRRNDTTWVADAAQESARLNGYDDAASDINVLVTHPAPGLGANFVEVITEKTVPATFMRVLSFTQSTVRARAVAGAQPDPAPPCVLALNPTASPGLEADGGAVLNAPACTILVNSNDPGAIETNGGGCITANEIGYVSPGGSLGECLNPMPEGHAIPAADPYAHLVEPDPSAQFLRSASKLVVNGDTTFLPGYYQGGIKINGGAITLQPGLYVVDGITMTGGSITGTGVTIYNTAAGLKAISFTGGTGNLSAPTSGDWKNILFFNSPSAASGNAFKGKLNSNGTLILEGVQYFPTVSLDYGGNQVANAPWAMIIADTIKLHGNPSFDVGFDPVAGRTPDLMRVALVE